MKTVRRKFIRREIESQKSASEKHHHRYIDVYNYIYIHIGHRTYKVDGWLDRHMLNRFKECSKGDGGFMMNIR